jgi:hypothetical protein
VSRYVADDETVDLARVAAEASLLMNPVPSGLARQGERGADRASTLVVW